MRVVREIEDRTTVTTDDVPRAPAAPCPSGKLAYGSRAAALRAVDAFVARLARRGSLHAYPCPHCGAWHLGRDAKRAKLGPGKRLRW